MSTQEQDLVTISVTTVTSDGKRRTWRRGPDLPPVDPRLIRWLDARGPSAICLICAVVILVASTYELLRFFLFGGTAYLWGYSVARRRWMP